MDLDNKHRPLSLKQTFKNAMSVLRNNTVLFLKSNIYIRKVSRPKVAFLTLYFSVLAFDEDLNFLLDFEFNNNNIIIVLLAKPTW